MSERGRCFSLEWATLSGPVVVDEEWFWFTSLMNFLCNQPALRVGCLHQTTIFCRSTYVEGFLAPIFAMMIFF